MLKNNPELRLEARGHTDSGGPAAYSKKLSEIRANEVMQYMIDRGVSAQQLSAVGYGETTPIASNETDQGRQENRRVDFHEIK